MPLQWLGGDQAACKCVGGGLKASPGRRIAPYPSAHRRPQHMPPGWQRASASPIDPPLIHGSTSKGAGAPAMYMAGVCVAHRPALRCTCTWRASASPIIPPSIHGSTSQGAGWGWGTRRLRRGRRRRRSRRSWTRPRRSSPSPAHPHPPPQPPAAERLSRSPDQVPHAGGGPRLASAMHVQGRPGCTRRGGGGRQARESGAAPDPRAAARHARGRVRNVCEGTWPTRVRGRGRRV